MGVYCNIRMQGKPWQILTHVERYLHFSISHSSKEHVHSIRPLVFCSLYGLLKTASGASVHSENNVQATKLFSYIEITT